MLRRCVCGLWLRDWDCGARPQYVEPPLLSCGRRGPPGQLSLPPEDAAAVAVLDVPLLCRGRRRLHDRLPAAAALQGLRAVREGLASSQRGRRRKPSRANRRQQVSRLPRLPRVPAQAVPCVRAVLSKDPGVPVDRGRARGVAAGRRRGGREASHQDARQGHGQHRRVQAGPGARRRRTALPRPSTRPRLARRLSRPPPLPLSPALPPTPSLPPSLSHPPSSSPPRLRAQVCRADALNRSRVIGQKGITLWMTGLSGSGKTTIAEAQRRLLCKLGPTLPRPFPDPSRSSLLCRRSSAVSSTSWGRTSSGSTATTCAPASLRTSASRPTTAPSPPASQAARHRPATSTTLPGHVP